MTHRPDGARPGLGERLRAGGVFLSSLLTLPEPGLATILGWSGYDYLLIDGEHGPFTLDSIRACLDAVHTTPAAAVVRVAGNDPGAIQQVLDLGADGVLVPGVDTAEQARAAVAAAKYPPVGTRGVSAGRAARYGVGMREYLATANDRIAVLLMMESEAAVSEASGIGAVDGVDGVVIGRHDLAANLAHLGAPDHPDVVSAVAEATGALRAAGTLVGTSCEPGQVAELSALGMTLFTCFADMLGFGSAAAAAAAATREAIPCKAIPRETEPTTR